MLAESTMKSKALAVLALVAAASSSATAASVADFNVGFTSYANIWFEPGDVLGNAWFRNQTWAMGSAQRWASKLSAEAPWTVTDKELLPASKNVHDYYSLSVYWWPNCSNVDNTTALTEQQISDECNYYQRDGVFNPDTFLVKDHSSYDDMTDYVYLSALSYAATNDSMHASAINDVVKHWFIDDDTYMRPNLNYSQVRRGPGAQEGADAGVLDGKGLTRLVAAVQLLRASAANGNEWQTTTDQGLVQWAGQMVDWLITSDQGIGERASANNHASFYFNQLCSLYILLNDTTSALAQLEWFYNSTFPAQISSDGDQPFETARTRPYHYRAYNLAALVTNAQLGDHLGLSPSGWNRTSSAGATLVDALHFAMASDPARSNETDQVHELAPTVAAVAAHYGDPDGKYADFLKGADPAYPGQPYFLFARGLSDSGITEFGGENNYGDGAAGRHGVPRAAQVLALSAAILAAVSLLA